jgi:predicted RNA-binding Zn-ribbon protein involved in translation (DUF1610 family)
MSASIFTKKFEGEKKDLEGWWDLFEEVGDHPTAKFPPGLLIEDRRLPNESAAWEAIRASHAAGGKALAISFYAELKDTKARKQLKAEIAKLDRQIQTVLDNGLKSLRSGKSPKVSCKKCKSSLARKYIQYVNCPMCGEEILSAGRDKKLRQLKAKKDQVVLALADHSQEPDKGGDIHWLAGGRPGQGVAW